jgi:hypothetical protein
MYVANLANFHANFSCDCGHGFGDEANLLYEALPRKVLKELGVLQQAARAKPSGQDPAEEDGNSSDG